MALGVDSSVVEEFAAEYRSAERGEGGLVIERWASNLGCSRSKAFELLKGAGAVRARSRRSDSGNGAVTEAQAKNLASLIQTSRRKTGQITMPLRIAVRILEASGAVPEGLSTETWRIALERHGFDNRSLSRTRLNGKLPSLPQELAARYANEWFEADVSPCLKMKIGKRGGITAESGTRFYGKDVQSYREKRRIIYRYIAIDHLSRLFFVHYYEAGGERAEDWVDFLIRAFLPKRQPALNPMIGVPTNLFTDRGSALKSAVTQNFLRGLDVRFHTHLPGNPQAKGLVEGAHNLWQKEFESRLFLPGVKVQGVQHLNEMKEGVLASFVSKNRMKNQGCKTRLEAYEAGLALAPEGAIRTLPEGNLRAVAALAHRKPVERVVSNVGVISFDGAQYRVDSGDLKGQRVTVYPSPYREGVLYAQFEGRKYEAALIRRDEFGRAADAVYLGEYGRAKDARIDKNIKALADVTHGEINPFPEVATTDTGLRSFSSGTAKKEIEIEEKETVMTEYAARELIRAAVGPALYGQCVDRVDRFLKEHGLTPPRSEVESFAQELRSQPKTQAESA